MTTLTKALAATALSAAFAFSTLAVTPAHAQALHHPIHHAARMDRRASRLEGRAAQAYAHHHPRRANRLSRRASGLVHHADRIDRRVDHRR